MTKNNKHSFKSVLALTLAALIATAAFLTGCGSSEESSSDEKETSIVTETQVVTRVVNGVYTDEVGRLLDIGEEVRLIIYDADVATATRSLIVTRNGRYIKERSLVVEGIGGDVVVIHITGTVVGL